MKRNIATYGLYPQPKSTIVQIKRDWLALLFFGLVFLLPLWPDFAELKMAGLPNLAPTRLMRAALIVATLFCFFHDKERAEMLVRRIRENWLIVGLLVLLYSIRFASGFIGHFPVLEIYAFIKNDFWSYLVLFFVALFVIRDEKDVIRIIQVIVSSAAIVGLVTLLEFYLKNNIFQKLLPVTSDYLVAVLGDKSRDNIYRAQGTLEHPLILGQFFVMVLPWCWYCLLYSENKAFKALALCSGLLGLASIYLSGSRSSIAVIIPVVALMFIWELWRWTKRSHNRPAQYLMMLQFPLLFTAFVGVLVYIKSMAAGTTQITRGSASVRLDMLNAGLPKLGDAIFMGHGLGEAVTVVKFVGKGGVRTLDNYYLLVGLESGAIALLLTVILWLYFLFAAIRSSGDLDVKRARLSLMMGLSVLSYIIIMGIHSLQSLTWLLLLVFACIFVLREKKSS